MLGTYVEAQLPATAMMFIEVDILLVAETNDETARLADLVEGVASEFSPFEGVHGFSPSVLVRPGRAGSEAGR